MSQHFIPKIWRKAKATAVEKPRKDLARQDYTVACLNYTLCRRWCRCLAMGYCCGTVWKRRVSRQREQQQQQQQQQQRRRHNNANERRACVPTRFPGFSPRLICICAARRDARTNILHYSPSVRLSLYYFRIKQLTAAHWITKQSARVSIAYELTFCSAWHNRLFQRRVFSRKSIVLASEKKITKKTDQSVRLSQQGPYEL